MNIFKKFFSKSQQKETEKSGSYLVVTLNDKVMPIDRGELYEDPLDEFIKPSGIGEVTGGGTMQLKSGEIEYCDIEIHYNFDEIDKEHIEKIIKKLEECGAPKGSKLKIEKTGEIIEFGIHEGLGIYLDGINLSDEVYANSDSEAIANEIFKLTNIENRILRYWQGNTETGLYFYSESFEKMKNAISDLVTNHPECQNCRVERIA